MRSTRSRPWSKNGTRPTIAGVEQLVFATWDYEQHFWGRQTTDGPTATDYVLDGLERLPRAGADDETRRALAHELVGMLRAFAPYLDESLVMLAAWSGGVFGKQAVLDMSEVDIRRVTGWPRLSELFARGAFASVRFSVGEPIEHDTRLERLINDEVPMPSRLPTAGSSQIYVKDEAENVGRNDPCSLRLWQKVQALLPAAVRSCGGCAPAVVITRAFLLHFALISRRQRRRRPLWHHWLWALRRPCSRSPNSRSPNNCNSHGPIRTAAARWSRA